MGICNGFQILTEAKLLPGALLHNTSRKFICKNVHLKADNNSTLLTQGLSLETTFKVPIAHGEGNFFASADEIKKIEDNGQVLFRYCDELGNITPESNPNGALNNIAGVSNATKNVFGMMPHPERASDFELTNTDGRLIFESLLSALPV
jgi:phosphoribosylformylglycinamidine synthase